MRFNSIRLARENLRKHRGRTRLSTLGIVISVFMVSLVFILSDSFKQGIVKQIQHLTAQSIIITGANDSVLGLPTSTPRDTLTMNDVKVAETANLANIRASLFLNGTIQFDQNAITHQAIVASNALSAGDIDAELADGNWFDSGKEKKWVVLGNELANHLLGTDKARNQVINIKGQDFTVIGTLKHAGQPLSILGYDIDKTAFISLDNGHAIAKNTNLSQISGSYNGAQPLDTVKQHLATALSSNHADSSDYEINTGQKIASNLNSIINYLTIASCVLAGIILLISTISIANAMLVNVVERRREIGIRKAVGATTRNITSQFIAESLIMSLRGGVIGLILAYVVAGIALLFMYIPLTFSWLALGVGFAIPVIIGIIAGAYPALRAARQNIITALNQLT